MNEKYGLYDQITKQWKYNNNQIVTYESRDIANEHIKSLNENVESDFVVKSITSPPNHNILLG